MPYCIINSTINSTTNSDSYETRGEIYKFFIGAVTP